ncbi:MAG: hypothetical protein AAF677_02770 [Pseudomonadota bacterium]
MSATDAAGPGATQPVARQGAPWGLLSVLGGLWSRAVAILLALHPLGAILVLGWLMRLMQAETAEARACLAQGSRPRRAALPGWLAAGRVEATGRLGRLFGGLWLNVGHGLAALVTLAAGTLPFTLLWLLAWWGGWENSFNKGYEQSWIGPTVALVGVAIALPLLARLPMALAHQAAEGRMSAFFARRPVARLMRAAGWRYVALAALSALAALPLFALQGLPVFVEGWRPGFAERSPQEVQRFIDGYRLVATAYLVLATIALRRMAARLYARASLALETGPGDRGRAGPSALLRLVLVWTCWLAVVAQVFVAQFLNHQWAVWLLPPLAGLPWFAPLAPVP